MSEADMDPAEISLADDDVRYVPTQGSDGDFCGLAHESRYRWVNDHLDLRGKWVLDFGCGSGYGSSILARGAGVVHGLDYSPKAIAYAAARFEAPNTRFMTADATSAEEVFARFGKRSYDVVVSFDVIEHIGQYRTYLAILAELIMKDGVLAIGCPNRLQTLNWNRDWNRRHAQEFSPAEFRSLLAEFFTDVTLYSQDFHNSQVREQARLRNYGSEPPLPPLSLLPDDIAITAEPSAEQLESAFGLMAVCRGLREDAERPVVAPRRCRVLLFEPRYGYDEALPWVPIGKGYLAAVVRDRGFDVRIVDNALRAHTDDELEIILGEYRPEIVGVGGMTLQHGDTLRIARLTRRVLGRQALLVGGGVHFTLRPEDGLDDLDLIAIGEGERTFLEVCQRYLTAGTSLDAYRDIAGLAFRTGSGDTVHTGPRPFIKDLDELPLPAYDLLAVRLYNDMMITGGRAVSVMSSRGCPYDCEFCASPQLSQRQVRYFSLDYTFRLIEHLRQNYGFINYRIMDDAFTINKKRVMAFCDGIEQRNLKLNMACLTHVRASDEEMFARMKTVGFSIVAFGVESGSARILDLVNKGMTPEDAVRAITMARSQGLIVEGLFMIGNIGETAETIEESIRFAKAVNPAFEGNRRVGFNWFQFATPFPGSRFYDEAPLYGDLQAHDFNQYNHQTPVFIPKTLDLQTMMTFRERALTETNAPAATVPQSGPLPCPRPQGAISRVLHVAWGHPPNLSAGPIYYLHQLCLEERAHGIETACFVAGNEQGDASRPPSVAPQVSDGITYYVVGDRPTHYFDWARPEREIVNAPIAALFAETLYQWNPQVVHFHNLLSLSMSLIEVAKAFGAVTVFSPHNYWLLCARDDLFAPNETTCSGPGDGARCAACVGHPERVVGYIERVKRAKEVLSTSSDAILAVSSRVKELFVRAGIAASKIAVEQIGSRAAEENWRQRGARSRPAPSAPEPVRFGFFGTMHPRKGAHVLLDAVAILLERRVDFLVEVFGGGANEAYRDRIEQTYAAFPETRKHFVLKGSYFQSQLPELLGGIDVAIIPPVWEDNGPQTVMETLGGGVPVIGAAIGGIPDLVRDGTNGLLFRAGDAADLARAMERILDDRALIPRLARGITPPRTMADHEQSLRAMYARLMNDRREPAVPAANGRAL